MKMAFAAACLLQVRHPANNSSLQLPTMQALLFWNTAMKIPPAAYTSNGASFHQADNTVPAVSTQQAAAEFPPLLSCAAAGAKGSPLRAGNLAVAGYPLPLFFGCS
jgi:hypothetical protein